METPSMIKTKESSMQKSAKQDRSALFDITNDSPIVGLAIGSLKTPSSGFLKRRVSNKGRFTRTPGSGEAILRGQVKTLLQKVEEEATIALKKRPFFNLISSPINLTAPTPASTPQLFNVDGDCDLLPQMRNGVVDEEKHESVISRSLFLDFICGDMP
ncbi:uncharacterized protein LOC121776070 [Salvia splendens]|uniref:uncharacterized protein LOC121776070 n=1 Tax=Salvia splendens TaxID=180675 RepID=UPI001C258CC5|nr:uncharacterized protein LOC121776070 [Salvia splendens]